jgi:phosphoglycerate dehydrogenase-like enzyme
MTRPVAVLLDGHEPEVRAVIADECPASLELRMVTSASPDERLALAKDAAFFIGGIAPIPASLMDAAPGLRLIQKWGIGVDTIDLAAARARGIPVAITAGANAIPVAEFTLLLMLAVLRRLPHRAAQLKGGEWNRARGDARLTGRGAASTRPRRCAEPGPRDGAAPFAVEDVGRGPGRPRTVTS